jgi:transcriptional regulator with XRE-family HTH domain
MLMAAFMSALADQAPPLVSQFRQARLQLGWTQAELATRAGLSRSTCARFERSGQITFDRLVKLSTALGLNLTLTPANGAAANPTPDARLSRIRQRGLRHSRPATPKPEQAAPPPAPPSQRSASPSPTHRAYSPPPESEPPIDPAQVAEIGKHYRLPILLLVRVIVSNGLTNYTSAAPTQNTMRANGVPDPAKAAFVAAVEARLGALDNQNCTALGIDAATYEAWSKIWNRDLGIAGALD